MKNTKKIALTGVMGAGKSQAAALCQAAGVPMIDCDEVNRQLLQRNAIGYQAVLAAFGDTLLDEQRNIDAQRLSEQIFCDVKKKAQLEAILHPLIQKEVESQIEQCREPLIIVEVPLLFETHWEVMFDEVWVVRCQEETLLERLQTYRHVSRREARRRLSHQLSQAEKCAKADVILDNDGSITALKQQIEAQLQRLRGGNTRVE